MKIILALTLVAILGLGTLVPGIPFAPKLALADDRGDNDNDGGSASAAAAASSDGGSASAAAAASSGDSVVP